MLPPAATRYKLCEPCEIKNYQIVNKCETFVEGVGPYCYYRGLHIIKELRPCNRCCTTNPFVWEDYTVSHLAILPDPGFNVTQAILEAQQMKLQ